MYDLSNKNILITGVCGTIGAELLSQLLSDPTISPQSIIGIDNNESGLFFLDQKYINDTRASFYVCDIRDYQSLKLYFDSVDVVFHVAALKHVVMCERSPEQAILTNINGVENVIKASRECGVDRMIFTSSDKAVNPTNVMGTTKLMGERLVTAANGVNKKNQQTVFTSTRFGNVLGSNGSVVAIFASQIAKGGPVTLTNTEMTRFVMSTTQAVRLVIDSTIEAIGGEVFVMKMPVIRIVDLAHAMIEILAPEYGYDPSCVGIVEIGTKPGEKLYEELMSDEETRRSIELKKFFSVAPAFRGLYTMEKYESEEIVNEKVTDSYVSCAQEVMTVSELKEFLMEHNIINKDIELKFDSRYWPGDKELKDE